MSISGQTPASPYEPPPPATTGAPMSASGQTTASPYDGIVSRHLNRRRLRRRELR